MRECWLGNPEERPAFSELASTMEDMLCTVSDYVELNMDLKHKNEDYGTYFHINFDLQNVCSKLYY